MWHYPLAKDGCSKDQYDFLAKRLGRMLHLVTSIEYSNSFQKSHSHRDLKFIWSLSYIYNKNDEHRVVKPRKRNHPIQNS